MTWEHLQEMGDRASVMIAARPEHSWDGERLDPRLWEAFRLELQGRWRRATGEEMAVLDVRNNPEVDR